MERPITEHFPESPPTRPVPLDRWLIQVGTRMRERFARAYDWLIGLRRVDRRRLLKRWRLSLAMLALLIATSGMPLPAHAAGSISVDPGASGMTHGVGGCSLAKAIANANIANGDVGLPFSECTGAASGANTITLPANATLNYTSAFASDGKSALPDISSEITIQGNGSTIKRDASASTDFRILRVANSALTLNRATISGGTTTGADRGAGIYVQTRLTLTNSTISGNGKPTSNGGGIALMGAQWLNITHSTISGNTAANGGGLYRSKKLYDSRTDLIIANSTISGNTANQGGGFYLMGYALIATIANCTITSNTASDGGGIHLIDSHLTLNRTIVSGNTASSNPNEIFESGANGITGDSNNLFGHSGETNAQAFTNFTPGASDINATSDGDGTSVHIATPLASILDTNLIDNSGLTKTHNLVSGSPALDQATGDACQGDPVNGQDQRHKVRAAGTSATCDIGAVEFGAPTAVALSSFHASAPPINLWQWLTHMWQR